jgi:hypothetical protein
MIPPFLLFSFSIENIYFLLYILYLTKTKRNKKIHIYKNWMI